jgi:hypothetical protein
MRNLPTSFHLRSGKLGFLRGRRDGPDNTRIQLYSWDFVGDCTQEQCPVFRHCEKVPENGGKCPVQLEYIRQTANVILNCFEDMDDVVAFKVGAHLIPLYNDLIFLKLERAGLRRATLTGNRGNVSVHPVIKELRETHRRITSTWKEIGLDFGDVAQQLARVEPDLKRGDNTLYSRMMASKNKEQGR